LARLFDRTGEMLAARKVFDPRALGWVAAGALEGDRVGELFSFVVVDGLYHLDRSQLAWIEALSQRIAVTVRLSRVAPDALLSTLEGRWHSFEKAPDLELFELGVPADVSVVAARTDAAEARAVVRAAVDAIRAGTPRERIAVVLPDADDG